MNSQKILLLLLAVIMLSSGCVLPAEWPVDTRTTTGGGVVIEHFGPDFNEVRSGEEVVFTLRVKNTGSVMAQNGFAELLGLDPEWKPGAGATTSATGEVFPDEERCRYTNKGINLLPGDPESGISGGEETCTWRYVAPNVLPGLTIHSKPRVRFYYSYRSDTIKTITLLPKEELKRLQSQGNPLPIESYSKTASPVSIDIEAASPIRTYGTEVEFPLIIRVRNIGGGTVCSSVDACKKEGWSSEEGLYKVDVEILLPSGMGLHVCKPKERVVLIGNREQTISCRISAIVPEKGIIQKNIEVRSDYGYFVDKTSDVFVRPSILAEQPSTKE